MFRVLHQSTFLQCTTSQELQGPCLPQPVLSGFTPLSVGSIYSCAYSVLVSFVLRLGKLEHIMVSEQVIMLTFLWFLLGKNYLNLTTYHHFHTWPLGQKKRDFRVR